MTYRTVTVTPTFSDSIITATAEVTGNITAEAQLTTVVRSANYNEYTGAYEFTPTTETQTIPTDHLVVMDNIVIDPIPSNYGLITWDGSTLMVS